MQTVTSSLLPRSAREIPCSSSEALSAWSSDLRNAMWSSEANGLILCSYSSPLISSSPSAPLDCDRAPISTRDLLGRGVWVLPFPFVRLREGDRGMLLCFSCPGQLHLGTIRNAIRFTHFDEWPYPKSARNHAKLDSSQRPHWSGHILFVWHLLDSFFVAGKKLYTVQSAA